MPASCHGETREHINIGMQNLPLVLIPLWLNARETLRPPSNFNATGSQFSFLIRAGVRVLRCH